MGNTEVQTLQDAWTPREDILRGKIRDESLAADAHEVAYGDNVPDVYDDAGTFFDLTYPTSGVTEVIEAVAKRIIDHHQGNPSETNGTLTLDTSFGGGKTHSQIAAYHFAEHSDDIPDLSRYTDTEATAQKYRALDNDGPVLTSVFVGTKYAPKPVKPTDVRPGEHTPKIQTMWGHIAYQLYGVEGYQIVSGENALVAPGDSLLGDLFALSDEPAVIIMDEIAAHLAHATSIPVNDGNLAEQTLLFLMALLGYASNNADVTVVMSVADDAFEDFAKVFERDMSYDDVDEMDTDDVSIPISKGTIQEFRNIEERTSNRVTPVEDSNIADVLRNRLFENDIKDDLREAVAKKYYDLYVGDSNSFPDEASREETFERIKNTYPFHPTLIDTLTKQIDAVPSFQKARGALKLLAPAVMRLWSTDSQLTNNRDLIRLYDLHPQDERTNKMLKNIFSDIEMDFAPAVKDDIYNDDPNDTPNSRLEDAYWDNRGHPPLGTRVVTTTLWKSLVKGAETKGTNRDYVRYACAKPGETLGHYSSAVGNLLGERDESACFYLHGENDQQLKFKTIVTVEKAINQANPRTGRVDNLVDEALYNSALGGNGSLSVEENPQTVYDVDDTNETLGQLVIVEPSTLTISEPSDIEDTVVTKVYEESATSRHGDTTPRTYKNNLIFLVPNADISRARGKAARLASIRVVKNNPDDFGLQDAQLDQLPTKRDESRGELENLIKKGYSNLYVPSEPSEGQPYEGLSHHNLNVTGNTIINAALEKLDNQGEVITNDEQAYSPRWLDTNLWKAVGDSMTTQELVDQIGKKRSAEILLDPRPLQKTIRRAVRESDSEFAYWSNNYERGYVDEEELRSKFNDRDSEIDFDESRNLVAASELGSVNIGSSERLYGSTQALLEAEDLKWQCSECQKNFDSTEQYLEHSHDFTCEHCSRTFATEQAYEDHVPCINTDHGCDNCGQTFDTEEAADEHKPCPWPKTVIKRTDGPAVASEAVSTITSGINAEINNKKSDFESSSHNIESSLTGLTLRLDESDAWKKAEYVSRKLADTDAFSNVTVELEYEARYDDSVVTMQFDGTAGTFSEQLKHTTRPSGSPDDEYVEAFIEINSSFEMSDIGELKDMIPDAAAVEVSVEATIELVEDEKRGVSA